MGTPGWALVFHSQFLGVELLIVHNLYDSNRGILEVGRDIECERDPVRAEVESPDGPYRQASEFQCKSFRVEGTGRLKNMKRAIAGRGNSQGTRFASESVCVERSSSLNEDMTLGWDPTPHFNFAVHCPTL